MHSSEKQRSVNLILQFFVFFLICCSNVELHQISNFLTLHFSRQNSLLAQWLCVHLGFYFFSATQRLLFCVLSTVSSKSLSHCVSWRLYRLGLFQYDCSSTWINGILPQMGTTTHKPSIFIHEAIYLIAEVHMTFFSTATTSLFPALSHAKYICNCLHQTIAKPWRCVPFLSYSFHP